METGSVTHESSLVSKSIQYITVKEHIATDPPEMRTPDKGGMSVADRRQKGLQSGMTIVISDMLVKLHTARSITADRMNGPIKVIHQRNG